LGLLRPGHRAAAHRPSCGEKDTCTHVQQNPLSARHPQFDVVVNLEIPRISTRVTTMLEQRMTRREAAAFLRERGFPIGNGTLDKLCMPTSGEGPPVAGWWGRRPLYDAADVLAWAEKRIRPARQCPSTLRPPTQRAGEEVSQEQPDDRQRRGTASVGRKNGEGAP
jgi:hypothetical protein